MPRKPRTAAGYDPVHIAHVRATCLYIATKLGDLVDELVIVDGPLDHRHDDAIRAPGSRQRDCAHQSLGNDASCTGLRQPDGNNGQLTGDPVHLLCNFDYLRGDPNGN